MKQGPDFESLFEAYGQRIYRYCLLIAGNRADAEDLTQETFLAAFKGINQLRDDQLVVAWLFKIARNKARKHVVRRRIWGILNPNQPANHDFAPELMLYDEISRLQAPWRDALLLVKLEGMSYPEASVVLGIPEGTVKYHVYQAIQALSPANARSPKHDSEVKTHVV